jgi:hypothetical protein
MRCLIFSALATILCLTALPPATACKTTPFVPVSYTEKVANGAFTLVMFVPPQLTTEVTAHLNPEVNARTVMREKYVRSGLYRNDGTNEPVWTTDEYLPPAATWVSPDGEYMVRHPRWGCHGPSGEISFYRNGRLFRTRTAKEYVEAHDKIPAVRMGDTFLYTSGDQSWIMANRDCFDETTLRFSLETKENKRITFDVTTGEIVDVEHLDIMYKIRLGLEYCLAAAVVLLAALFVYCVFRSWCRPTTAAPPTSAAPTPA